ncbi:MAG TPA: acyl-CoA dehydrogenase family protein [Burkholderiaceae bacterium]|nr:acyl-CoA dehydrogenase family protein [Burkholderiaceae bacterium]
MNAITRAAAAVESGSGFEFVTQEQRMIRETALRLGREVIAPTAAARDRDALWPRDELRALAGAGFMGMMVPEEHGGAGAGFTAYCLALEALSGADCGVGTIFHVHNMFYYTVARHGTPEQKRRWLPPGASGDRIGAWLLTEPHFGSDTASLKTTARRDGDGYVLDGTKQFISNGSEAGAAVAMAITDPAAGRRGISAFLLDPATPGYTVTRVEHKMGQRTAHVAQIRLDGVRVPADSLLGEAGAGYRIAMSGLADGRIAVAAQAVGVAQAALDAAVRYAKEREAYGRPIFELQAVSFRLAEMATSIAVARQFYLHAARLLEAGLPCSREAAMAKLYATEMAERVCSDALQTFGGYGYLQDFPVERYCRDVRVCKIYEGTSDIQKLIVSRSL